MRHMTSFAILSLNTGLRREEILRLLGHLDIRASMIYAKVQVEVLEEAIQKLNLCYKNVTQIGSK